MTGGADTNKVIIKWVKCLAHNFTKPSILSVASSPTINVHNTTSIAKADSGARIKARPKNNFSLIPSPVVNIRDTAGHADAVLIGEQIVLRKKRVIRMTHLSSSVKGAAT